MKLVYTRWKDVKKFLASIDEPLGKFTIVISPRILPSGRRVFDVEIPRELIDGSLDAETEAMLDKAGEVIKDEADSRSE